MSVLVPLVCVLGGIGIGVVGTLIGKKVSPDDAVELIKENKRLASDLAYQEDLARRNCDYAGRLEQQIVKKDKQFRKLKAAAETHEVHYVEPDLSRHTFGKKKTYVYFESTVNKNFARMLEEFQKMAGDGHIAVKFTMKVIGSWKKHLREQKWTWHDDDKNKNNVMTQHGKSLEFVGSPEKVVDEIKAMVMDPYWSMYTSNGKLIMPDAPITFECEVRLSSASKRKPEVTVVNVAVVEQKTEIVEKPVYIERTVYHEEGEKAPADLQEMIRAQLEVELAMRERDSLARVRERA